MLNRAGYDKRVDWWAVGIIMYEMLFGKNPFKLGRVKIQGSMYWDRVKNKEVVFPESERKSPMDYIYNIFRQNKPIE